MSIWVVSILITGAFFCFYLGKRFKDAFQYKFPKIFKRPIVYWLFVFLITMSFFIVRLLARSFDFQLPFIAMFLSSTIFAICTLAFFTTFATDLLSLLTHIKPLRGIRSFYKSKPHIVGYVIVSLVMFQFIVGIYNASYPRETYHEVAINKPINGQDKLRIVQVSDIHVTDLTSVFAMERLVERVNGLNPDIIVITGDLIDSDLQPFIDKGIGNILINFKATHGVYYVLGNHEYYGGAYVDGIAEFEKAGMTVLRDTVYFHPELGITIIGRDDPTVFNFGGNIRKQLSNLMKGVDTTKPIIVLDHQPRDIQDGIDHNIDLQFSGHTHGGQFFPITFVVDRMYKNPWGHLVKDSYNLIVSCGFGVWGPPIRILTFSEIVVADIVFEKNVDTGE